MNIEFLSTIAVIASDPPASRKLYVDALGLPLESHAGGDYHLSEEIAACKSFGIWPLSQAAEALRGPTVAGGSAGAAGQHRVRRRQCRGGWSGCAGTRESRLRGAAPAPRGAVGQTVARQQSPEGAVIGISYAPVLHDQD